MTSLEIRNKKLQEFKALKEKGIRKVPFTRDIGKKEQDLKETLSIDDNFSTEAQIFSVPGSSLVELDSPTLSQPSKAPSPGTTSKKSEISNLQSLIQSKKSSIESLLTFRSSLQKENNSIKSSTFQSLSIQSDLRETYTEKRKALESSISSLLFKMSHCESPSQQDPQVQKLHELRRKLEGLKKEVSEKEANCKSLKKMLDELTNENGRLRGAAPSFIPDPPAEEVMMEPSYRNLISDVGSTGNLHKRTEEAKGLNYPSPDPLEANLPQSTGETKYVAGETHYQGGATPPNDSVSIDHYDLPCEESKDPGTPKRDTSNPRDSSGSSTPRRYRDSNPQVHNLLGPSHNPYSEEENDFFNVMTREKRKPDPGSKSLFD